MYELSFGNDCAFFTVIAASAESVCVEALGKNSASDLVAPYFSTGNSSGVNSAISTSIAVQRNYELRS
jgi:hypothetical protein